MITEVIKLLWPFLKEFFLGKEGTLGGSVKKREYRKVAMLLLVTFCVCATFYLVPKSILLADQIVKLKQHCEDTHCDDPDKDGLAKENAELKRQLAAAERGGTTTTNVRPGSVAQDRAPVKSAEKPREAEHHEEPAHEVAKAPDPPVAAAVNQQPRSPVSVPPPSLPANAEYWRRYNNMMTRFSEMQRDERN